MTIDERKERIVVLFSNHYAFGAQANSNDISLMLNNLMNAVREDALQQAVIDIARVRSEGVAEGYRKGCIEKDTEWRRGYNQGWEERKAFDEPGGAVDNRGHASVLAPKEKT